MNKIQSISGCLESPWLTQIRLSDNLIKDLNPQLFSKCQNILKVLYLDINQLKTLKPLTALTFLEELSVTNNQIASMEGLEKMGKMRRLNLSFNKLTDISEKILANMTFLEYLELGKNFISGIETIPTHKLLMIQELYLYSN